MLQSFRLAVGVASRTSADAQPLGWICNMQPLMPFHLACGHTARNKTQGILRVVRISWDEVGRAEMSMRTWGSGEEEFGERDWGRLWRRREIGMGCGVFVAIGDRLSSWVVVVGGSDLVSMFPNWA